MVVRYDARGTGLSDRQVTDFSGTALAMDIAAVAKAAGLQLLALWGNTLSGPRAIMYASLYPKSVSHLVLYDTFSPGRFASYRCDQCAV
jgi:pimeloyl-ACP methyl ester carboxylesterase